MRSTIAVLATLALTVGLTPGVAQTDPLTDAGQPYDKARSTIDDIVDEGDAAGELRVGTGQATTAFRAGAKPGQVGTGFRTGPGTGAYPYATVGEPGDGWHSEPMAKAFVIERPDGERVALVKTDLYLMQHSVHKRVADLVVDETGIDRSNLFLQANHDHSHPYANSPSWGLCLFTDCFDIRQWSYTTRQIADAVTDAVDDLQPAQVSAAQSSFREVQRNVIGPECATTMANGTGPNRALALDPIHETIDHPREDGCVRAGFPDDHFESSFSTIRFDTLGGTPIGAIFSLGMHPETLANGHGLTSAEYPGMVEQKIQHRVRERSGNADFTAGWFVGALGDVEPAEGDRPDTKDWWRETFSRSEDLSHRIADAATGLFEKAASQGTPQGDTVIMPPSRDLPVDVATVQLSPPEHQPYGPSNSYITEQGGWGANVPSTRSAQETTSTWLTAIRLGEVLIAGYPGEPITDVAHNFESRVDRTGDNVDQGYTWPTAPTWVEGRVAENFDTDEVADHGGEGYRIPLMFGMSNDWTGYHVTKWEYDNRNHYRESMTPYGNESAEFVTGTLVEMAAQLAGGEDVDPRLSAVRAGDDAALDAQYAAMVAAEQSVRAYRAAIPANQGDVGATASQPDDGAPFATIEYSWVGGSNAVDLPRVELQQRVEDGWRTVGDSIGHQIVVRLDGTPIVEDPIQANPARDWTWTASYEVPWDADAGTYRFVVDGEYRSAQPDPDRATFFDPTGADRAYHATSQLFEIADRAPIPTGYVNDGAEQTTLTFEPTMRDAADPGEDITVPASLEPDDGSTPIEATLTANAVGELVLDESEHPAGSYTLTVDQGAWVDPAGNPNQAAAIDVTVD
jgi:hypothetical protein